jgi:hypothetical protein
MHKLHHYSTTYKSGSETIFSILSAQSTCFYVYVHTLSVAKIYLDYILPNCDRFVCVRQDLGIQIENGIFDRVQYLFASVLKLIQ